MKRLVIVNTSFFLFFLFVYGFSNTSFCISFIIIIIILLLLRMNKIFKNKILLSILNSDWWPPFLSRKNKKLGNDY